MSTHATSLGDDARSLTAALDSAADENTLLDTLSQSEAALASAGVTLQDPTNFSDSTDLTDDERTTRQQQQLEPQQQQQQQERGAEQQLNTEQQ